MASLKLTLAQPAQLLVELTAARAALKRSRGQEARESPQLDALMVQLHARLFPGGLAAAAVDQPPP
jgi:hypothetical protein